MPVVAAMMIAPATNTLINAMAHQSKILDVPFICPVLSGDAPSSGGASGLHLAAAFQVAEFFAETPFVGRHLAFKPLQAILQVVEGVL